MTEIDRIATRLWHRLLPPLSTHSPSLAGLVDDALRGRGPALVRALDVLRVATHYTEIPLVRAVGAARLATQRAR